MAEIDLERVSGSKWMVLKELSKKPLTPNELSDLLEITPASISHQLKLLEAYGYVKKKRIDKGKGSRKKSDRRTAYFLDADMDILISIKKGSVNKKVLKSNLPNQVMLNLMVHEIEEAPHIMKFFLDEYEYLENIDAIFYVSSSSSELNLLVIAESVDPFRTEKSNVYVEALGKKMKIAVWSHTAAEMLEGLKRGEQYFKDQATKARVLFRKDNKEMRLLEEYL